MSVRHSEYPKVVGNFFVEPAWAADALHDHVAFTGGIHDGCAGSGTIVDVALKRGLRATGADIADRANGRFPRRDFLADTKVYPNFVTNPPFALAVPIIEHAIEHVVDGGYVAVLAPVSFLCSQSRFALFSRPGSADVRPAPCRSRGLVR